MLTDRQELVLRRLVEEYLDGGSPVGSKALSAAFEWGPSTIRHELANLEELGLLAHPHTSAGRIPTEAGYRYFVDRLLPVEQPGRALSLSLVRRELDEAMRVTTETLSQVTDLLAIVTSPPIETSTIRHIEVLALQPQVLMVVVITSTGGVSKRLFTFSRPVDTGLSDWAASYLNERLVGLGLGARMLHQRLHDPSLSGTELEFLEAVAPVFTELEESAQASLYVDGTARLLTFGRIGDVSELNLLMDMLERRVALLEVLRSALTATPRRRGPDRRRERGAGAAVAGARRGQLRAAAAQSRHGLGDRAAADGLRPRDPCRPRCRRAAFELRR